MDKSTFTGKIVSIQPRIRLNSSFDQVSNTYFGYVAGLEAIV